MREDAKNEVIAPDDVKRKLLESRLENSRAEAYLAAVNAEASRAAALAMKKAGLPDEAKALNSAAYESDKKAKIFSAAAQKFSELLSALPPESKADDDDAEGPEADV